MVNVFYYLSNKICTHGINCICCLLLRNSSNLIKLWFCTLFFRLQTFPQQCTMIAVIINDLILYTDCCYAISSTHTNCHRIPEFNKPMMSLKLAVHTFNKANRILCLFDFYTRFIKSRGSVGTISVFIGIANSHTPLIYIINDKRLMKFPSLIFLNQILFDD